MQPCKVFSILKKDKSYIFSKFTYVKCGCHLWFDWLILDPIVFTIRSEFVTDFCTVATEFCTVATEFFALLFEINCAGNQPITVE
jgi:hypothetical protein